MLITDDYRDLNKEMHAVREDFGANGHRFKEVVVALCKEAETRDVLDYGCGKGNLRRNLPMVDVKNYDPAVEEWSAEPKPADIVVCTDVLEHVEPDCLVDVLKHIASLSNICTLLSVATRPAIKVLPDGRNAHLIQEDLMWWIRQIHDHTHLSIVQLQNTDDKEFMVIYRNPKHNVAQDKKLDI
jgi:hypothetical protein